MRTAHASGATLLPIDSEHNAIFQCLPASMTSHGVVQESMADHGVEKIFLTASGGPFLDREPDTLHSVTPDEACRHPNWVMGRKISIDSATMMNKGLELIEACWLFNVEPALIDVVIHSQGVIHSMVSYRDGSVLAQLGSPDMCTPIAYGLGWPERIESGVKPLDLFEFSQLDFRRPDDRQFPCLALARQAAERGGAAPMVLNAANEVAVASFLSGQIRFTAIAEVVKKSVSYFEAIESPKELASILEVDAMARERASAYLPS